MSTIPRANFGDPLLQERSRRRGEQFRSVVLHPAAVVVGLAVAIGLGVAVHPLAGAGVVAAVVLAAWVWAGQQAAHAWWQLLIAHLGFAPDLPGVDPLTPLLRSGDEREVLRAATDGRRRLLVFRSTDVSHGSKGERQEQHHDYTCVVYRDPAPAIRFLSAHEHRAGWAKWLGDDLRGRTVRDVDEFQVESVQLHERFELRSSTEDALVARQIFEPSFIVWFARSGVAFEYEGGDLVVMVDRVLEHAEEYKVLLSRADQIHAALTRVRG
jgi:hypothetical protein